MNPRCVHVSTVQTAVPLRSWLASSFRCVPAVHVQVYHARRAPSDQTYNAGRAVTRHDSLASFQAIGEMAWQLVQVENVNGCNLTAIATSHSSSDFWILHVIHFSTCENVAFLVVEASVCSRFCC